MRQPGEVVPLDVLVRENPQAFVFPDLRPPNDPSAEKPVALETILGDFTPVGGGFFIRPIKMKQQKTLLHFTREARREAPPDALAALEQVTALMGQLLCRPGEGDAMRAATADEIDDAFSAEEQMALLKEFTGLAPGGDDPKNR